MICPKDVLHKGDLFGLTSAAIKLIFSQLCISVGSLTSPEKSKKKICDAYIIAAMILDECTKEE